MKQIKENVVNEIVVEKSRFITYLFKIDNEEDAISTINSLKKKYSDATHVIYAYRLNLIERSNDDGEPKGTAGIPTLEVLRKEDLINALAVTVRYFGGIKLGAGGLLRTYINSLTEALSLVTYIYEKKIVNVKVILSYKDSSYFDTHYNNYLKIEKIYDDKVTYNLSLGIDVLNELKEFLAIFNNNYVLEVINEEVLFL